MAQGGRSHIRLARKLNDDEGAVFDALMLEAYDKPWWRQVILAVEGRRNGFLTALVNGETDQRAEDKLRGQINELNFFLLLDQRAEQLIEERRNGG